MNVQTAMFVDSKGPALKTAGRFSFHPFLMRLEKILDLIFNSMQRYDLSVSFITPDKGKPVVVGLPTKG